ncbi:hypothetical protein J2Y45_003034 [Dyadobacter sp. BE34]|uniref:Uncharacterized protein n=1 Tax=Dyadobacter fermentans TaxID=94254 RepID=A0ABU1QU14_9BACT|nr:hypothetical protein [Dyadobacter fermentans]MDR7043583.1 hypothetical protein [Dyadobacter sp. BE242]MDR7197895.1 hypothetical protein [Dyadobacter sp. BE34]MDR7214672.1 hypothetical protein [Dyadobacter sp. BE31]MDR7262207.1 hypothetical protein [Dyadobacter sp. BE32]
MSNSFPGSVTFLCTALALILANVFFEVFDEAVGGFH